jgi:hypothetical protein
VEDYQRTCRDYRKAMEFGAGGGQVRALEAALRQRAAGIHATYESRLFLKTVADNPAYAEMIADFNQRLGQVHADVQTRFRQMMIEKGFDDVGNWVLKGFRHSAGAGSLGMDYDVGLMPRPLMHADKEGRRLLVNIPFTRKGVRVSPIALHEEAARTWAEAYQAVTGWNATRSFDTLTNSADPEIYTDLAWLGDETIKDVKINEIIAERAAQAGALAGYQVGEPTGEPVHDEALTRLQAMTEAAREMANDIQAKLLPLLDEAGRRVSGPAASRFQTYHHHWQQIGQALQGAGNDPIRANEQIRLLTGGKEIPEIARDLRDLIANYGKALGK